MTVRTYHPRTQKAETWRYGKFEVNLVYTLNFKTSQGHVAISYISQQNETKTEQQSSSSETRFLLIF